MNLKHLITDDDAVSPVIGVILMVAITVILAAVIGTFVLGLGDRVNAAQPTATFTFDYSNIGDGTTANDEITIMHDGGDKLDGANLKITVGGTKYYEEKSLTGSIDTSATNNWDDDSITAGDEVKIKEDGSNDEFANGDTVKVIWSSDSGKTAVIGEGEVQ